MSKINREQFEVWGMSDTDLRITLECETYAGIAWLAWQAATNEAEAKLTALTSQLESVVAECSGLRHLLYKIGETGNANFGRTSLPTPATSAFLAEVRASGVDAVSLKISNSIINCRQDEMIGLDEAVNITNEFAAQLRLGGAV